MRIAIRDRLAADAPALARLYNAARAAALPGLAKAAAALGPRLSLFCIARNTGARAFYERHGFRVAATSDGAGTEEGEPDVLYVRDAGPLQTDIKIIGST